MSIVAKFEQSCSRYVHDVRQLLAETFGLSEDEVAGQDKTWNDWLGLRRRDSRQLGELLKADVNDSFKARAIAIFLAPSTKFPPFVWCESDGLPNLLFLRDSVVLANLSPALQAFTLGLLEITFQFLEGNDGWSGTICHYNRFILQALAVLGEDDPRAARLFDRYQINDLEMYESTEGSSGYNPLRTLFFADVPEKWKRLGDGRMREVIRAEQEGRAQPRCPWEKALSNYAEHIQVSFCGKKPHYSVELFSSQVGFILELPNLSGQRLFNAWHAREILEALSGEEDRKLRHRFVRHLILDDHGTYGNYQVTDGDALTDARMMLEAFGESDAELRARLVTIIAEGQARLGEREASARAHQSQTDLVMAGMRR